MTASVAALRPGRRARVLNIEDKLIAELKSTAR